MNWYGERAGRDVDGVPSRRRMQDSDAGNIRVLESVPATPLSATKWKPAAAGPSESGAAALVARGGWGIGDRSDWSDLSLKLRIETQRSRPSRVGSSRRGPVRSISTEARPRTDQKRLCTLYMALEQAVGISQTTRPARALADLSACLGGQVFCAFSLAPRAPSRLDAQHVQRLAGR